MIEQIILVRHGETEHNVAGIAQGWNDSPLSARGQQQVDRLAERLRSSGADAIFSSPLGRALSTAKAIARTTGLPVQTVEDLCEMGYGSWENRSFLDVRRDDTENFRRWIEEPDFACPGGESHETVRQRADAALRNTLGFISAGEPPSWRPIEARVATMPKRPVIVSHGTAIRILTTAILELPVSAARQLAQDNASMNLFLWRGDRWVLKAWNDVTHHGER